MTLLFAKQIDEQRDIYSRRVVTLCKDGRIHGAQLTGKSYTVARIKSSRYIKHVNKENEVVEK